MMTSADMETDMNTQFFHYAGTEPFQGKVFYDENQKPAAYRDCERCDGSGYLAYYAWHDKGICYGCAGAGKKKVRLYTEKQNAAQLRRFAKAEQIAMERRHVLEEINSLLRIKEQVRQGFWNIEKINENAASNHVGAIGDRIDIDATIKFCMGFEGFYGTTYINTMVDADGNIYVYKGGKRLADKGASIRLKATIKDHGEYKGAKQTIINRPKVTGE